MRLSASSKFKNLAKGSCIRTMHGACSSSGLTVATKLDALVDGIVAAVRPQVTTEELGIMQSIDPKHIRIARLADCGAALCDLLASAPQENQLLHAKSAAVSTKAKDAGEFTFGDRRDFSAGI